MAVNTLITYFQLFIIGFSIGISGPCFLSCGPVIIAMFTQSGKLWKKSLFDILTFLSARFSAYLLLGYIAGFSAQFLRKISMPYYLNIINNILGIFIVLLGILILFEKKLPCRIQKVSKLNNIIVLGFLIGISPCPPLLALLFEITLISKSGWDGLLYAVFFGLGTFVSGLIFLVPCSGFANWIPSKIFQTEKSSLIFRIICGIFIILFGMRFLLL